MSLRKIQLYILTIENEVVMFMIIEACYNVPMINEYRFNARITQYRLIGI